MPLRLLTNVKLNKNQSHLVITICTVLWVSYSQTARNSDWFITLFAPVCLVWVIALVSFFRESFENCSMTPDAKAFTMAYIPEFAAIHLEPFAFLCIKRRAWALKGFTIAAEWLNDMCLCVALTYTYLALAYYWSQTSFEMAFFSPHFTDRWACSAIRKMLIT